MNVGANRRADTVNRRILVAAGGVLLAVGALIWVASFGAFTARSSDIILSSSARSSLDDRIWIGWIVGAVLATLVLLLAGRWLAFELRPVAGDAELNVEIGDDIELRIDLDSWLDAVLDDVRSLADVRDARGQAELSGGAVELTLLVDASDRVDLSSLAGQLESYVVKRAEHSLDRPVSLHAEVELAAPTPAARVH